MNSERATTPRTEPARVLVCAVNYRSETRTASYCKMLLGPDLGRRLEIAVADNSPQPSSTLAEMAAETSSTQMRYFHFPRNPGYAGAARLILARLVADHGPLPHDAIVLSNVDLVYDPASLVELVEVACQARPDRRWVLAPRITEAGSTYEANPHVVDRPASPRHGARDRFRTNRFGFPIYRRLHRTKRATRSNPQARLPEWSPIYSPHGSFVIFGAGYFIEGGSLPEAPLFEEEYAIAEMARTADIPVLYSPGLVVEHESGLTTSRHTEREAYRLRRPAYAFYRGWSPDRSMGLMTNWFRL